jgi:hypothetical protein
LSWQRPLDCQEQSRHGQGIWESMRVQTQVSFDVVSDVLSPDELEARIGMPPSSVMRKASKHLDPPRPVANAWKIGSGLDPDAPLWQHLEALREVVAPVSGRISDLCQGEPAALLRIVRKSFAAEEQADLGFWLDEPWLAILRQTGAELDVDEYDFTLE